MMKRRYLLTLSLMLVLMVAGSGISFAKIKLVASQPDFPKAKLLVSADSVQNNIGAKNFVVIDARTSGYETSHIPGAINLNFMDLVYPVSGLQDVPTLESQLGAAGLKRNMTMVIYDNPTASGGAAGRIFWILEYLGCKKVHILDGGWDKWVADGKPTETNINALPETTFKAHVKPSVLATKEHIAERLNAENFAVIDTRDDEYYMGWKLASDARGGHIPGAVSIPHASLFNPDETVRDYKDLEAMFTSLGITKKKEVTAYC
jgi:3-mercaptopyruvate sulfurtransferase SseA